MSNKYHFQSNNKPVRDLQDDSVVKARAAKPDDLNSIPGTHMVGES